MNYYEHHLGDYAASTAHLSWDEDMAYSRLIRAYYQGERPIPDGETYRLARASTAAQRKAVDAVLREFFVLRDGAYHQKRCDKEIERFRDKQEKARASINSRWDRIRNERESNNERNTSVLPTNTERNTPRARPQTPDTITTKPTASADKPPDPIFGSGLAFLTSKGVPEKQARGVLGKLRKMVGDDIRAAALLADAELHDISDPIPWLSKAAVNASAGPKLSKTGAAYFDIGDKIDEFQRQSSALVRDGDSHGHPQLDPAFAREPAG